MKMTLERSTGDGKGAAEGGTETMVVMMGKLEWQGCSQSSRREVQSKKSGARNDKNGEKETADEKGLFLMEIYEVEKDVLHAAGEDESKKRKGGGPGRSRMLARVECRRSPG
jgi:hypothetical protein